MLDRTVLGLVKDLTTRLSAIASEFGDRADRFAQDAAVAGGAPLSAPSRCEVARRLLAERNARSDFFPPELFHEPAWDMMLALFVADEERRTMNVKTLVGTTRAPVTTSQRWIDHLAKLKLIDRALDPADRRRVEISLSDAGSRAVVAYLDRVGRW